MNRICGVTINGGEKAGSPEARSSFAVACCESRGETANPFPNAQTGHGGDNGIGVAGAFSESVMRQDWIDRLLLMTRQQLHLGF